MALTVVDVEQEPLECLGEALMALTVVDVERVASASSVS